MKIKNIILFLSIICLACMSMSFTNCKKSDQEKKTDDAVVALNLEEFNKKVFDTSSIDQNSIPKFLGEKPAVIDFYANWCGPCRKLSPIIEELAKEYKGKIDFYKINVDDEKQLAGMFGIRSLPTLLFISKEGNPQVILGLRPKEDIVKIIDQLLKK